MHAFRFLALLILISLKSVTGHPQAGDFLKGYVKSVTGETIQYHAPDPSAKSALLLRSQDSTRIISWETEQVPSNFRESSATFAWLFGIDATPDSHFYTLAINGQPVLRFANPKTGELHDMKYVARDGTTLHLRTTMIDRYGDVMGVAILRIPASRLSPVWYMTFEHALVQEIRVHPEDIMICKEGKNYQSVRVEVVYLGNSSTAKILSPGLPAVKYTVDPGYNAFRLYLPEVSAPTPSGVIVIIGKERPVENNFLLEPVRKWTFYFVQHTHTDIGYTRPQSVILPEHLRFIDYALDYCDLTDSWPADAQFRWTCETAWAVKEYIKQRPTEQVERLKKRIAEGRIEVAAMEFNMAEIADESALSALLQPVELFHENGIHPVTAMQNDVNGIGWCLADYLPSMGVKYLIMGINQTRSMLPFSRPTCFWWQSPAGNRILAFRGEHYMFGNSLLLHTRDMENFRLNLMNYIESLEEKAYPFNEIGLQYSGYVTDNSPPSPAGCEMIRRWNEQYVWPKLRSATASEFLSLVEKNHGNELDTYQAAWPDWWTDGFGSAARETGAAREAQADMVSNMGLFSMAIGMGSNLPANLGKTMADIYENILFYDEHTFGAAESISDPDAENSVVQWAVKSSYPWDALKDARILRESAMGLLQQYLPRYPEPSIAVFNTLGWARSGLIDVYIDHEQLPPGIPFTIVDAAGKSIPVQARESRSDGTYWSMWVENIPAMGYRCYRILRQQGEIPSTVSSPYNGTAESPYYTVKTDMESGAILSLTDKEMHADLAGKSVDFMTAQLIYERLSDRHQLDLLTLEQPPRYSTLHDVKAGMTVDGPLWTSIQMEGLLEDCSKAPVQVEYRLYKTVKMMELIYTMDKKPVTDPEALYVAFPLKIEGGQMIYEAQGGLVQPGINQIPGSSSDWNTVQDFIAVRSGTEQVILTSPEIPLVHLGGLNIGKFRYVWIPANTHIFSWVLNNYWFTNFKASQEGTLKWRYFLTSGNEVSDMAAYHFGIGNRVPLVSRVLPDGKAVSHPAEFSMIPWNQPEILLVSAQPLAIGHGFILHLREISGKQVICNLGNLEEMYPGSRFSEVNVLGEKIATVDNEIIFPPYGVKFLKIAW
jgi:alpha-mannosidase